MNAAHRWSADQALVLILAQRWLGETLPPAVRDAVQPDWAAAEQVVAQHAAYAAWYQRLAIFTHWDEVLTPPSVDQQVRARLQQALFEGRQVDITRSGKTSRVHPFGWAIRNDIHYLACTFWNYSDPRWVAVHRISAVTVHEDRAASQASLEVQQEFLRKPPLISDDTAPLIHLEVEFPAWLYPAVRERPPRGTAVNVTEPNNGYFLLTGQVWGNYGLYTWLLGFKEHARIVKPEALRRTLQPLLYDTLTDLPQRHELIRELQRRLAEAQRTGQPLSLVMIDLDHFGQTNKHFDQMFGDKVLRHAVACMRGVCRAMDTLARCGGEEFWLLLPATDGSTACRVAERLRCALEQQPLLLTPEEAQKAAALIANPPPNLRLRFSTAPPGLIQTASLGVAGQPPPPSTGVHEQREPIDYSHVIDDLLARAAQALHCAKTPRNRVVGENCNQH